MNWTHPQSESICELVRGLWPKDELTAPQWEVWQDSLGSYEAHVVQEALGQHARSQESSARPQPVLIARACHRITSGQQRTSGGSDDPVTFKEFWQNNFSGVDLPVGDKPILPFASKHTSA